VSAKSVPKRSSSLEKVHTRFAESETSGQDHRIVFTLPIMRTLVIRYKNRCGGIRRKEDSIAFVIITVNHAMYAAKRISGVLHGAPTEIIKCLGLIKDDY
jgi:hypothetical protein